ncbi:MAG: 4-alpha-glucanotransferase [Oscillospiraceae bacterium]|nr:4-alpha-glucanotransferase [Oscillospiraceae bacterium]
MRKLKSVLTQTRRGGILLPVFSLPSPYGIGTFGKAAYKFVDFLDAAGQSYWQLLPLGPVCKGNSPYSSLSSFAGNPLYIDLDMLAEQGLLLKSEFDEISWGKSEDHVEYGSLTKRDDVFRAAYKRVTPTIQAEIDAFRRDAPWLDDYALYMAIQTKEHPGFWYEWPRALKFRDSAALEEARSRHGDEIGYWMFLQYEFFLQWTALKKYANKKGIAIIGDIPIYAAMDSVDVWTNPELFYLDDNLMPVEVSGCPPDAFSADGQLWQNPLYRWDRMQRDGYAWWIRRLGAAVKMFDVTRIDHFRGFDSYYAIPASETTARNGHWREGPGYAFFAKVKADLQNPALIAEDLGYLTESVRHLLKRTGYPGMKVLQFAFNPQDKSEYLPFMYDKNCVVYTGTHDNDTALGWYKNAKNPEKKFFRRYVNLGRGASISWAVIRAAWASPANTAIAQIQDFLELDSHARINFPGIAEGNWGWRLRSGALSDKLCDEMRELTELYGR